MTQGDCWGQSFSSLRLELRARRLYRDTHKTWEQYCQSRFGYSYRFANLKISKAKVFENLVENLSQPDSGSNCSQSDLGSNCSQVQMGSNCSQVLPTNESQCRELARLDPEQQPQAWLEAQDSFLWQESTRSFYC